MKWIAENPDKLKPPLAAKTIFREDDFMVTVVGGPNTRTDYHVNPTEEFFFQLKGTVNIRIQHEGRPYDIALPEGSIYLLPAMFRTRRCGGRTLSASSSSASASTA